MKVKYLSLMIIIIFLFSCVTSPDKKQAKIYMSGLESLLNGDSEDVVSKIIDMWEFKCTKIWRADNPSIKDIIIVVRDRTKFTKQEANKIFSSQGQYKVMFFFKYLRDESVSIGNIPFRGYNTTETASVPHKIERHAFIRVVFKEDKLIHFRVWPSLEVWIS